MKRKIFIFALILASLFSLSACGKKSDATISDYLIEERNSLFVGSDSLYCVTLSSGKREKNYAFDGVINEKVDFAILTLSRLDNSPLSNDTYNYAVTIGENTYTGELVKSDVNNSYSADLEIGISDADAITTQVSFAGYTFNQNLENLTSQFAIKKDDALRIANENLSNQIKNQISANTQVEVVMKILKDYSASDCKNFYWYVGSISTDGDTLGVLINANSGEVVAKKV